MTYFYVASALLIVGYLIAAWWIIENMSQERRADRSR
jgi:ABC-type nickel/cobalt efflux system permease component RcnA